MWMLRMYRDLRSALLLTALLGSVSGAALAQQDQAAAEPTTMLENIVVTAEKREENQQTVPIAITAFTSQTLTEIGYEDLVNLNAIAPGVTVREAAGGNLSPNFTMRGVYGSSTFASDPGIALYVDGIYLSETNGADMDLADIDQIEILRGPQGTLFGRNAIGGAVSVTTKEPTGKFDVHEDLTYGNLQQIRSKTRLDTPTWNDFSASLTFLHDQEQGDVRNSGANTAWNYGPATGGAYGVLTSPNTLGGHDTNAVSADLKYESDLFKVVYRFNYSHKLYVPEAVGVLSFNTGPGEDAVLGGIFGGLWQGQNPATRTPLSAIRPDYVNNWYSTLSSDLEASHNITVTAPIGDHVNIKNLLAWRSVNEAATNQLDGLGGLLLGTGMPVLASVNDTQSQQRSFQEELTANIDTEWVKSTVGYMHYFSHTVEGGFPNVLNAPFGSGIFPGVPAYTNFVAPVAPGVLDDDVHLVSDAVYTQNEIHILPKLDLVLGARITTDHRGGLDNSPTPTAPGVPITYNKNTPTYLAGLNYKITEDIFAYAKWSTAYITGGVLANIAFNPETAKSFEVGIKSDLLEHTLRVNLAGFTAMYDNVQVLTDPAAGCAAVPGVSVYASQCIVSGGNEKANGVEAEITYVPVQGLTLGGNMSYTHVSLSDIPTALLAPDGNYVPVLIPPWTGSLSAEYHGPSMGALDGSHVTGRIEADYTSNSFGSTPNSSVAVADAAMIPARTIVNGRLGLGGFQVGAADAEVALFVKNLTNNKAITYDFNASADIPVNYQFARTYGINLIVDF
jgi:iron complex outermembrane recepter protein